MKKQSPESIYKDMKKAKYRVMSDPEIVSMFRGQKYLKVKQRTAFRKSKDTVAENTRFLKKNSKKSYRRLVESCLRSIDEIINSYSSSLSQIESSLDKPSVLYKFMPQEYATDNILSSSCSFGSVGLYRQNDRFECTLPISSEMDVDQQFDRINARIIHETFRDEKLDVHSVWDKVQDVLEKTYYIGCFTDGKYPEKMWHDYANDDGVCVQFVPDYTDLHRVVYADYLAEAGHLRKHFMDMMIRLSKERYQDLIQDLEDLVRKNIELSIMSFFTKKPQYDEETEWRILVPSDTDNNTKCFDKNGKTFIIHRIPGTIIGVESRMPAECNRDLEKRLDPSVKLIIKEET